MQPVLNVEDIKQVERRLTDVGVSISELMHRAGAAAAQEVLRIGDVQAVTIFCGLGNNGGDGWVAAEDLVRRGLTVHVVTPVEPSEIEGDLPRVVAKSAQAAGVDVVVAPTRSTIEELLDEADVALDAIFGTGFHGVPRAPFDIWIDCLNASPVRVVAADVPSGLQAQTGHADGAYVVADVTCTMLALKPGLVSDTGRDACGSIVVAPLAAQTERLVLNADPVAWRADLDDYLGVLPEQSLAVDKYSRGSVLVVGGSPRYPGAAMMAALAAARAGAGYVTLAVPDSIVSVVQAHMMEIPVIGLPSNEDGCFAPSATREVHHLAQGRTVTLVGPGMGISNGAIDIVSELLSDDMPLVIDADGLNCLAKLGNGHLEDFPEVLRRSAPLVLTPHRGELGRLLGLEHEERPDSLTAMLDASRRIIWAEGGSEICVVAKGSASACVSVESAILPKPGPAALATAGSGDVLGGIIAALLAQIAVANEDIALLAALACEIHAYAGTIAAEHFGSRGVMAGDVIDVIGVAADTLTEQIMVAGMGV